MSFVCTAKSNDIVQKNIRENRRLSSNNSQALRSHSSFGRGEADDQPSLVTDREESEAGGYQQEYQCERAARGCDDSQCRAFVTLEQKSRRQECDGK